MAVTVTLQVSMRLPRRLVGAGTPSDLRQQWTVFSVGLLRHEQGHPPIATQLAQEIERSLWNRSPQPSCSATDSAARGAAESLLADLPARNRADDRDTHHGQTQGATFP